MPDVVHAECLCGSVRIAITLPVRWCAHCHCSMCRRAHGAPYVTWTGVPDAQVRFERGEDVLVTNHSSEAAWRRFCGRCGSPMLFGGERWPGEVHVARALIAGDIGVAPMAHAYYDSKADWVDLDDHLPKLGGTTGTEPL